jgi:hypothetical protein
MPEDTNIVRISRTVSKDQEQNMFVISVPFSKEHKYIRIHTKEMLECRNGHMSNHPEHCELITALRTAVEK